MNDRTGNGTVYAWRGFILIVIGGLVAFSGYALLTLAAMSYRLEQLERDAFLHGEMVGGLRREVNQKFKRAMDRADGKRASEETPK